MAGVVFVGLGFGGLYTLRHLLGGIPPEVGITAIDHRSRFVFTPLLYEYLTGELEGDVVAPPYETLLPPDRVMLFRDEVVDLDLTAGEVHLAGGDRLEYDALVLAPGSLPAYHGVEGAKQNGVPFYSFEDADRLGTILRVGEWSGGPRPVCVVGGGVVGIELAFALAEFLELGGHPRSESSVIVLEAMDDIIRESSPGMRSLARRKLAEAGIEVRTSVQVLEVGGEEVVYSDAEGVTRLEAVAVAWAAGIQPSPLLAKIPAERHGRHGVRVEPTLQLPGFPNVFVLGDAISYPGSTEGDPLPDTAQAAHQQSEVVSKNLRSLLLGEEPRAEYRYAHLGDFLRLSRGEAIADIRGVVFDGGAASLARRAAYLFRMPDWAIRTTAIRQWLG